MNSGIVYGGNDNIFEYNEIYRVGLGSSDLGCFYTNAGWTSRGNIIRYNLVHHSMNANAFYVDDGDAGDTFINNVAYKTRTARSSAADTISYSSTTSSWAAPSPCTSTPAASRAATR